MTQESTPHTIHTLERHLHKEMCVCVCVHIGMFSSLFHKTQKLETVQTSINRTMDKCLIVGQEPEQKQRANHRDRQQRG